MKTSLHILLLGLALSTPAALAGAEVAAVEADELRTTLTPIGAERAGNAAGTIPPWTGGITRPPADYEPGQRHPDPFPDDRPLFGIGNGVLTRAFSTPPLPSSTTRAVVAFSITVS